MVADADAVKGKGKALYLAARKKPSLLDYYDDDEGFIHEYIELLISWST